MTQFRLSRQADSDLEAITDFIANESPASAARVLNAILETLKLLGRNSSLGMLREDLVPNVRMFVARKPAQNYIIFYYQASFGIEVSDIVHGSQDWVTMFEEGERGKPPELFG